MVFDLTRQRACKPATIVVTRGLVYPPLWCGRGFPSVGKGVKKSGLMKTKVIIIIYQSLTLFMGLYLQLYNFYFY